MGGSVLAAGHRALDAVIRSLGGGGGTLSWDRVGKQQGVRRRGDSGRRAL